MKDEYGTLEIQQYLKELLDDFHCFCIHNKIEYSVWDGSLLGTIRHKGFIPWDDDVDVIFDRKNYNRFIEACRFEKSKLCITRRLWINRIEFYDNPYSNIDAGVIDLFVFDNVPDNRIKQAIKICCLKCLQGMMKSKENHSEKRQYPFWYKPLVFITAAFGKLFRDQKKFNWYETVSQWGNKKTTRFKGVYNEPFSYIGRIHYPNTPDSIGMMQFENIKVMVFDEYDRYLSLTFGDYMELPPKEDRKPQHVGKGEKK